MRVLFVCAIMLNSIHVVAQSSVNKMLNNLYASQFSPSSAGCVVLVARHGKVIYQNAFGKVDIELDKKMKPYHLFRIGSITKQFTAVAILQLVEKGLVDLRDDVTKYLPDYPTHGYSISVENLLSHTSGIKNFTEIENLNLGTKQYTPIELIDVFKDQPMDFEPGTQYHYSNSGYVILGLYH